MHMNFNIFFWFKKGKQREYVHKNHCKTRTQNTYTLYCTQLKGSGNCEFWFLYYILSDAPFTPPPTTHSLSVFLNVVSLPDHAPNTSFQMRASFSYFSMDEKKYAKSLEYIQIFNQA